MTAQAPSFPVPKNPMSALPIASKHKRLLKTLWPSVGTDIERIIRWMVEHNVSRSCLNRLYARFSHSRKAAFYARFAKVFRHREAHLAGGFWEMDFRGRRMVVPLRRETMWLDWDMALSVLGHEPEIKQTYGALLDARLELRCVFDIGANYGIHSLLFLMHGVRVVSFEPNPACHSYIERLEELNDVQFTVVATALGSCDAPIDLWFPEREVWLGTTDSRHALHLSSDFVLKRRQVPCATLDAYVRRQKIAPDLIKMDTEGSELEVLHGARRTLESARPILILESWRDQGRAPLWQFLSDLGYALAGLPLIKVEHAEPLDLATFSGSAGFNFAALPKERLGSNFA